jgi:pimeloyl-ACP methyl ester carboxylesterase
MSDLADNVRFSRIRTNGIHLHVAEAGPPDGPLVFLLHGFPEFWYGWRNQILPLANGGFHVVAPDQRGYNLSDKPAGVASYDLDLLAADVIGLADYFGRQTFAAAGHDWGSVVGWWTAGLYPGRVERLAILNAPHPAVWVEAMHNNPLQRRMSGYVRLLGIRWLPEFLIHLSRFKALSKAFHDSVRQCAFTDADLNAYAVAWSQPGALTAMIHYYRAVLRRQFAPAAEYRVSCPVSLIWGRHDAYVLPILAELSNNLCDDGRIVWLENATHWVQHDQPERVAELLEDFLRERL